VIKGQKFGVNLKQSINADTYNYDVKPFSPEVTALEGNFIERKGGLTNNSILEETHAIPGDTYYTDEGQRIIASHGFRPRSEAIAAEHAAKFPAIRQFTLAERFGDWAAVHERHFASGGTLDAAMAARAENER
jgi:hypothetical protein